jgi:hypothetical protein
LFLKEGRSLWDTFDPMVVMVTEFVYGDKKLSVPFVVGSGLFGQQPGRLPHGLLFNDILAAGPHPFRGGNVAISLVLYRVKRDNYAKGILKVVESISSAVGIPANIGFLTKVGDAFIDGLEALLNLQDTVPIMGHRVEIDTSTTDGLPSSYWMLTSETNITSSQIVVENGRLAIQGINGIRQPFSSSDYVLYSLTGSSRRGDESTLPFYPLRKQALESVLSGEEGWKRSKATLLSMYGQMAASET